MTVPKIRNERQRLLAGFLNALAIGAVGAAALLPAPTFHYYRALRAD